MEGGSRFNGGNSFLSGTGGGGGIGGHFDWGVFEKNSKMGGSSPPLWETLPLDFCWHQHFVTANLQFLLYQKIQI